MSQGAPSGQPPVTQVVVNQAQGNGLGIAGFVVSLLGFFTCGLLCPIGLILSFIGLFKAPRGFAVAGTLLGFGGSLLPVILPLLGFTTCCGVPVTCAALTGPPRDTEVPADADDDLAPPVIDLDDDDMPADDDDSSTIPVHPRDSDDDGGSPAADDDDDYAATTPQVKTPPDDDDDTPTTTAADKPQPREWTSADGQFTVTATYRFYAAGEVTLIKEDGSEISVPLDQLSAADKAYVQRQRMK